MVNKLKAFGAVLLCLPLVGAWPNSGQKYPTAAAAYAGPGDVVAGAEAAYGLRPYTNSWANGTNAIIKIIRASDSHTCDLIAVAANNGLGNTVNCSSGGDNAQSATAFCNSTTCKITKMYDMSGANECSSAPCDVSQATGAKQPGLSFNCLNTTLPCATMTADTTVLQTSGNASAPSAQPFTYVWIAQRTSVTGNDTVISCGGGNSQTGFSSVSGDIFIYAGGNLAKWKTATENVLHAFVSVVLAAGTTGYIDGAAATADGTITTSGSACNGGLIGLLSADTSANGPVGNFFEAELYPGALTSGNVTALFTNQNAALNLP